VEDFEPGRTVEAGGAGMVGASFAFGSSRRATGGLAFLGYVVRLHEFTAETVILQAMVVLIPASWRLPPDVTIQT
jgi:hypothetical protein